ncbi:AAA family ATPase [Pseudomonas aeruginosa]|uniref:AAA family ATPase n=1 Tax=Pseudomonas aeruginosa TaxID=287 RepID=UPI001AE0E5F1|nr:AAA family ATPase [Pseudomonas aeruginosa]MDU0686166.1 AAA family ATPase [Pseudomonas aeruginosa]
MSSAEPLLLNTTIRVTAVRSRTRKGCIAFGHRVDLETYINDRASAVVLRVPAEVHDSAEISIGGIFDVYGEASVVVRTHGNFAISETTLDVQDLRLVKPSGAQVVGWLADNAQGVGEVKATRMWDALGNALYVALDNADHESIKPYIPSEGVRVRMFSRWAEDGDGRTLRFVQEKGIPLDLARKAIKFHRANTVAALTADPYRLLSFCGSWACVDEIARKRFGLTLDDARRLAAALEESLYRALEHGHTCSSLGDIQSAARTLLKPASAPMELLTKALENGARAGQFLCRTSNAGEVVLYSPGTWLMERRCAEFVRALVGGEHLQALLFAVDVDDVIDEFEGSEAERLKLPQFALNEAQRAAVHTAFNHRLSIITGGAGVGKTTVLKALYKALDHTGRPRFQMALSGRAAARMAEATGEDAYTIAGFLKRVGDKDLGSMPILVIDEASMLDLVTFYRLVEKLPDGCQLILVGDPYQLPPIGAGLVFHVLCDIALVPKVELVEVKRQARDSGIPQAALAIRQGGMPAFGSCESSDVVFLQCSDSEIESNVLRLYEQDPLNTRILGATKSCPYAGVATINRVAHGRYANHALPLVAENPETGEVEATGFCVGDRVMYTRNDWERNLQNGSLGELLDVYPEPRKVNLGTDDTPDIQEAIGQATFEGALHYLLASDVESMEYAFAITVHKSQGSQFPRVIVPIRRSKMLDRTLVYTALTRAQVQVVFVGSAEAVREAVLAPPKAFSRRVGLRYMLEGRVGF